MSKMDQTEFQEFIDGPWIAHLVAVQADGTSHVAPVWYEYADGRFLVFTPGTSVKLGHIRNDPRVAISIASEGEPYRYVTANGIAEISADEVHEQALSIARRYRGDRAERFLEDLKDLYIIAVTPTKLSTYVGD